MSLRALGERLLLVLLSCIATGMAQEKPASLMVRIAELRSSKYTCTVLTQDGRLRREVSRLDSGHVGRADVFEGVASEEDVKHVKALVAEPSFQTATRHNATGLTIASPEGRILTVEANLQNEPQTVSFVDRTGTTALPSYLVGLFSFSDDVKDRNLPKIKGKVETMCRRLSEH